MDHSDKPEILLDKGRNVVADIEDQPDRDKAHNAVNVGLHKTAQDVSIEKTHELMNSSQRSFYRIASGSACGEVKAPNSEQETPKNLKNPSSENSSSPGTTWV